MTKHLTKPIRAINFLVLAFLMTLYSPVAAQDFQKGLAAAQAGDFATALQEWKPLAEAGNADAQYNLGIMYNNGYGVPQDQKEATKWFRLAAEQGNAGGSIQSWYHVQQWLWRSSRPKRSCEMVSTSC